MKVFKTAAIIIALFICGCIAAAGANGPIDNSPTTKAKRAAICKKKCNEEHYNIKFIRVDGTLEEYKVSVVSILDKIGCECKF